MASKEWKQTSHRSWERADGAIIVKQYCQRAGGVYFMRLSGYIKTKHRTLEEAQNV